MGLDYKLRNGAMTRRDFSILCAKALGGIGAGAAFKGCKSPVSPDPKPETRTVDIELVIRNATRGEITSKTLKDVLVGSDVSITYESLNFTQMQSSDTPKGMQPLSYSERQSRMPAEEQRRRSREGMRERMMSDENATEARPAQPKAQLRSLTGRIEMPGPNETEKVLYTTMQNGVQLQNKLIENYMVGLRNTTVDHNRMTLRNAVESVGDLIQHTGSGTLKIKAPYQNAVYGLYLYDTSQGQDYSIVDNDTWAGAGSELLGDVRNYRVHIENRDGQICPEGVWWGSIGGYTGACDQVNAALSVMENVFKFKWGSLTRVTSGGHFGVGAGYCEGADGLHLISWVGVDYNKLRDNPARLVTTANSELVENLGTIQNLRGVPTSASIGYHTLSPAGVSYIVYMFAKDKIGNK